MQDTTKVQGYDKIAAATENLLSMFELGQLPAAVARTTIAAVAGDLPSSRWSLGNRLLMMAAGTEDARGFHQWKDAGRSVRKGSRALYILGPRTVTRTQRDEQTGEETKVQILVGFVSIPVFRIEDTDGAPVTAPNYTPDILPHLYRVAEAWGYKVTYGAASGGAFGWHREGQIHLMSYDADTLWHELAHAAHAKVLEARGSKIRGGQVPEQEIVAEMTAAVLSEIYGETGGLQFSRDYIAAYAKRMGKDLLGGIMHCLSDVEHCLQLILEAAAQVEPSAVPA